jgi:urease accessory protein UreH
VVTPADISHSRPGQACFEVEIVSRESSVTCAFATNPLKLLTPRARGQSVWACTSSFGGGLVAGDQTRFDIRIGPGARCYLGTQAATKIYRNPSLLPCGHTTGAILAAGSLLVFAPDPVQAFAGSTYMQRQEFQLASDASLVLLDWFTSGRAARGERWAFNRFQSRNEVRRARDPGGDDGSERGVHAASVSDIQRAANATRSDPFASPLRRTPSERNGYNAGRASLSDKTADSARNSELIFLDSIRLDPDDGPLDSTHRTGRFNCFATLLLLGPMLCDQTAALLAEIAARPVQRRMPLVCSASPLRDGALLRVAGEQVEVVARELHFHLAKITCLLGDDPWQRKW